MGGQGIASGVTAAITEELIVVVAPVLLLRWAHVSTPTIVASLIVARVAYHVYYGAGTVAGLAIWAAIAIWVFWRTQLVWSLLVAHAAWDGASGVGQAGYPSAFIWVWLGLFGALLAAWIGCLVMHRRQSKQSFVVTDSACHRWQQVLDELAGAGCSISIRLERDTAQLASAQRDPDKAMVVKVSRDFVGLSEPCRRAALAEQVACIRLGRVGKPATPRALAAVFIAAYAVAAASLVSSWVLTGNAATLAVILFVVAGIVLLTTSVPVIVHLIRRATQLRDTTTELLDNDDLEALAEWRVNRPGESGDSFF